MLSSASTSRHRPKTSWPFVAIFAFAAAFIGLVAAVLDARMVLILFLPVIPIIWILVDYRAGIVFLAFILPFSQSQLLPKFPGFNLVGYLSLATLFSFGLYQLGRKHKILKPPAWLLTLYVLPVVVAAANGISHISEVPSYMTITEAFAHSTPSRYIKDLLIYPMLTLVWMWIFANAMKATDKPVRYIWVLCFSAVIPAIAVLTAVAYLGAKGISIEQLSGGSGATRGLLSLTGFHANEVGALLASVFGPLLFVTNAARLFRERLVLWVFLVVVFLALVLTFSRGAYVAAGVVIFLFLARSHGNTFAKLLIVGAIVGIAASLGGAVVSRVSEGWAGAASSDARATAVTASRTEIWRALMPDVEAHPVLGNGLRSTAWSSAAKNQIFPTHPHNLYLEIVLDIGLVGLLLMGMFFTRFAGLLRYSSEIQGAPPLISAYLSGAFASLVGYLVSAVANGHYTPVPENTFLWASLGVAIACSASRAEASDASAAKSAVTTVLAKSGKLPHSG